MSLAVMTILSVPWARTWPASEHDSARVRSAMIKRLMQFLLGDEVAAGSVAGGHGTGHGLGAGTHVAHRRTARRESAADGERDEIRRRAGDGDERAPFLAAAYRRLHQPGGVGMLGTTEELPDRGLLHDAAGIHDGG